MVYSCSESYRPKNGKQENTRDQTSISMARLVNRLNKTKLSHPSAYSKPVGFRFFPMGEYKSFAEAYTFRWQPGRSTLVHMYGVPYQLRKPKVHKIQVEKLSRALGAVYSIYFSSKPYNLVKPTRFKSDTFERCQSVKKNPILSPSKLKVPETAANGKTLYPSVRNIGFKVSSETNNPGKFNISSPDFYGKPRVKLKENRLKSQSSSILCDSVLDVGFGGKTSKIRQHFALHTENSETQGNNLSAIFATSVSDPYFNLGKNIGESSSNFLSAANFEYEYGQRTAQEILAPYKISNSFHERNIKNHNNVLFVIFTENLINRLFSLKKCLSYRENCKVRDYRYRPKFIDLSEFDKIENTNSVNGANIYLSGWKNSGSDESDEEIKIISSCHSDIPFSRRPSLKRQRQSSSESSEDDNDDLLTPRIIKPYPISLSETKSCFDLVCPQVSKRRPDITYRKPTSTNCVFKTVEDCERKTIILNQIRQLEVSLIQTNEWKRTRTEPVNPASSDQSFEINTNNNKSKMNEATTVGKNCGVTRSSPDLVSQETDSSYGKTNNPTRSRSDMSEYQRKSPTMATYNSNLEIKLKIPEISNDKSGSSSRSIRNSLTKKRSKKFDDNIDLKVRLETTSDESKPCCSHGKNTETVRSTIRSNSGPSTSNYKSFTIRSLGNTALTVTPAGRVVRKRSCLKRHRSDHVESGRVTIKRVRFAQINLTY